jgi:hypothetical protein
LEELKKKKKEASFNIRGHEKSLQISHPDWHWTLYRLNGESRLLSLPPKLFGMMYFFLSYMSSL